MDSVSFFVFPSFPDHYADPLGVLVFLGSRWTFVLGRQPLLTLSSIFLMDLLHREKWQVSVWPALIKYLLVILMAFLHLHL
jgi:hypothetical protein